MATQDKCCTIVPYFRVHSGKLDTFKAMCEQFVEKTETDLKRVFPRERWNKLHLQIIFFGREHCPARGHDPRQCPICSKYGRKSLFR